MSRLLLSTNTTTALSEIDVVSPDIVNSCCKFFLEHVLSGSSSIAVSETDHKYLSAISTLLLESARQNMNIDAVRTILIENNVDAQSAAYKSIIELYERYQEDLVSHIQATGIAAPTIVDVSWRLDHSIRSKHGGRENMAIYFVTLQVNDRGIIRDIEIMCNLEEMQDLTFKLRDACKAVDTSKLKVSDV